ncbi:uncharacterized protein F4822DRAFT_123082 [Hypoxylon trugodes]|uniref:uncharacterized protein n=1 Tax=Hypoxylon trugodes TaxID=326681 RepID=UPI00219D7AEA|nr:uncharacterized protein F4822DRAFT_123082 [Hypoxylon trugodes]KAI1392278.1 hypothetical protein F4822DRAFT_123082 [Hypoxylon trugodes]
MKGLSAILCVSVLAVLAPAAPVATPVNLPNQAHDISAHARQQAQPTTASPKTKLFLLSFLSPSRVSTEKHPNVFVADDGRRIQMPDNLAGAKSWETPNVLRFLNSLTRPKKLLPFPESSIMREETRANMAETEPQETIVELETKAERESWAYLPYMSQDNVLHFRCVRKAADTVMLAIPLALSAILLITVLWSVIRFTFCASSSIRKGAICLQDEEIAISTHSRAVYQPYVLRPSPSVDSSQSTVNEKSQEI